MSKTVTQNFLNAWGKKYGKNGRVQVQYQLRYWNGAAYVYTGTWVTLGMRSFSLAGQIVMKLDVPLLNTIKSSNVSLRLKNTDYQWLPTNITTGIFKPDSTATLGYDPFLTKFRIQFGYQITGGTFEVLNMFTGVGIDFIFDTQSAEVEVVVSGNEYLLESADAQLVSDTFTAENCIPATGDGANKIFTTTSLGVSYVGSVTDAGVTQTQGSAYTVSNTNSYGQPATITFSVAPIAGHAIKSSGRSWKTLNTIDVLVGFLCDQAGITAGNRTIAPVIFPGGLSGRLTIDTQGEWAAGTVLTNISTTLIPGSIVADSKILVDDFSSAAAWTATGPGTVSASGNILYVSNSPGAFEDASRAYAYSTGKYVFRALIPRSCFVQFFSNVATVSGGIPQSVGYAIGNSFDELHLYRNDNGTFVDILDIGADTGVMRDFIVTRDGSGNMSVYGNGLLLGSVTDNNYTTNNYIILANISNHLTMQISNLYADPNAGVVTGIFESAVLDALSTPTAWGLLDRFETLNGGTTAYQTASSTDGMAFDAYVSISGGYIQSALKRYIKIKATIVQGTITTSPEIQELVANFTTTTINLSMADFSGKNCFTAIQDLTSLADYEFGFDGAGLFFFRSKTVSGSPVVVIDQSKAIARITDFRLGYDAIINVGQVTYGAYYNEYNSASLPESAPTSQARFLTKTLPQDLTSLLLANDVNIAAGRAQLIHDNNYLPKRRARLVGKIIPQLDLSDIITVSYFDRPILRDNIFGDPLQKWPATFGTPTNILLRSVNFKVVGITADPVACTGEYDIQEVL